MLEGVTLKKQVDVNLVPSLFPFMLEKQAYPVVVSKKPHKYFLRSPYVVLPNMSLWANRLPLEYMYT